MVKYSLPIARLDEYSTPSQGHTDSYHVSDFHFLHEISGFVIAYALPCSCLSFLEVIYTELAQLEVRLPTRRLDFEQLLTFTSLPLTIRESGSAFKSQKLDIPTLVECCGDDGEH